MMTSRVLPESATAANRYWCHAGRNMRLAIVSIGESASNAARARAVTARASHIGMPLDQEVWGHHMSQETCRSLLQQLNCSDSIFAVLVLPDVPEHLDLTALRANLHRHKDLMRPGAWHCAGPVRPGEVNSIVDSAIAAHRFHNSKLSDPSYQSAR
ncbi:Tetrahydrofolate dehydrogenase/cyclohydrolase, catalytic domain [Ruegeria halocynthiae]|uniref:Tetrahydrofolate dehydrogenase/cyclohydrolase, catalytic domain n=1 Tax=Ruegeria halocynthiae TaxID=985054 RepID=A0A1H3EQ63_9RHOB|nr:Tetrahydrofolate dehydrogenase/cyclohydrolase, catalytic domain [Ruegeria halocynthiae]